MANDPKVIQVMKNKGCLNPKVGQDVFDRHGISISAGFPIIELRIMMDICSGTKILGIQIKPKCTCRAQVFFAHEKNPFQFLELSNQDLCLVLSDVIY